MELKSLRKNALATAFEKAKHYRLLNDPENAESICLDILNVDPEHQDAIVILILALADQFDGGTIRIQAAQSHLAKLKDKYQNTYYAGLICERAARSVLNVGNPGSKPAAYNWFRDAMHHFEQADPLSAADNNDAILRWNACARAIEKNGLEPRNDDRFVAYGD